MLIRRAYIYVARNDGFAMLSLLYGFSRLPRQQFCHLALMPRIQVLNYHDGRELTIDSA